jgi:hypothetical protein
MPYENIAVMNVNTFSILPLVRIRRKPKFTSKRHNHWLILY